MDNLKQPIKYIRKDPLNKSIQILENNISEQIEDMIPNIIDNISSNILEELIQEKEVYNKFLKRKRERYRF
jgi:hypothetical protein